MERDGPLAVLDDLLTASAHGGRVAVVAAEAGAGKSSLVDAFTGRADRRARVLWGACDPLLTPRALGPLHDIARQAGGALAERLADLDGPGRPGVDDGRRREPVFDALLDLLDAPRQRLRPVVVLEDLHWADEATLDLIVFLGRRLARCRALLILTCRDDEIGPDHRLRAVLAGLPRPVLRRLPLTPLSFEAVATLARRAGRFPTDVYDVTGGNPLLVSEVLSATGTGVPPTVQDLVLSRLASVSPAARRVAELVSVVPTRADRALLADQPPPAVGECLAHGLLVAAGDGVAYRHELLRRAVEESLTPVHRTALHTGVLATLGGRPDVDPARLVHHAHLADDVRQVLRWAPVAARRAESAGAYRQAVAHYRLALPRAGGLDPPGRAELLEAYASASYLAGDVPPALEARREALALRRASGGDPQRVGENLRWVSRLSWWTGDPSGARTTGRQAVEVLAAQPPGRELAMAYSNLSQLHMLANEDDAAVDQGGRALVLARQLGDVETEAHALVNIGSARLQHGDPDGVAQLEAAHAVAAAAGLDDEAARALVNLGGLCLEQSDHATAGPVLDRIVAFTAARDLDGYLRHMLGHRALHHLAQGDWARARADAERALAGPDQPGGSLVPAMTALGQLCARRAEPDAYPLLERAAERAYATGELQFVGPAAAALAEYHWLAGDPGRCAAEARRGYELASRVGHPWHVGRLCWWLWTAGELDSAPVHAAEPYRLSIAGDWAAAADEWQRRGCPYARAEVLAHGPAQAAAEALRILDGLAATATARRIRVRLRDRGLTRLPRGPRPATSANALGLTARQLEVVALLADGLSNAEIAGRLCVSAKTVDHHVSAVLGKLDAASRGQAAATARRLGLLPPT